MFYRQGGGDRINQQYDYVYSDVIGNATAWLPISKGDTIAVNIARASIAYNSAVASVVTKSALAPECSMLLEMKMFGGDKDVEAWPIDQWQNVVVATSRRAHRNGYVRLRVLNLNNADGTGIAMAMQISRTGETGAVD